MAMEGYKFVSACEDETASVWDLNGNQKMSLVGHKGCCWVSLFSPDGSRIVTCSADYSSMIWNTRTGAMEFHLKQPHTHQTWAAAWHPTNRNILATGTVDNAIFIWTLDPTQPLTLKPQILCPPSHEAIRCLMFSPSGEELVSSCEDLNLSVWDWKNLKHLRTFKGPNTHSMTVRNFDISSDGLFLASASKDESRHQLILWNYKEGTVKHDLVGHNRSVWSTSFSPDVTRLASAGDDGYVIIWEVETGKLLHRLQEHFSLAAGVSWSWDSKFIVSSSSDKSVVVWDPNAGKLIKKFNGGTRWVRWVNFDHSKLRFQRHCAKKTFLLSRLLRSGSQSGYTRVLMDLILMTIAGSFISFRQYSLITEKATDRSVVVGSVVSLMSPNKANKS